MDVWYSQSVVLRYERRKSQMASIEDSMAELGDPSQLLGNYNLDQRRASRISRRSHRSSVGGRGSINGNGSDTEFRNSIQEFNQGLTTTTTAEVKYYYSLIPVKRKQFSSDRAATYMVF